MSIKQDPSKSKQPRAVLGRLDEAIAAPGEPDEAGAAPGSPDQPSPRRGLSLRRVCVALFWIVWEFKTFFLILIGLALVGWRFGLGSALLGLIFAALGTMLGSLGVFRYLNLQGYTLESDSDADGNFHLHIGIKDAPPYAELLEIYLAVLSDKFPPETVVRWLDSELARLEVEFMDDDEMVGEDRPQLSGGVPARDRADDPPPIEDSRDEAGTFQPFLLLFPQIGMRETRIATIDKGDSLLPAGSYAFSDYYCADPDCDCRRVRILVVDAYEPVEILATLGYGWASAEHYQQWAGGHDSAESMKGIYLEPMATQTQLSPALLDIFADMLKDKRYAADIKKHYRMMKKSESRSRERRRPGKRGRRR